MATDYYTASNRVTFERIAELTGVDQETISAFNPQFRRGIIPGNNTPYPVRLPLSAILKLDSVGEGISSPELRVNLEGPPSSSARKGQQETQEEDEEEVTTRRGRRGKQSKRSKREKGSKSQSSHHRVHSGETLSSIARKYGVSVSELKLSNGLSSDRLSVGQKLTVKKK